MDIGRLHPLPRPAMDAAPATSLVNPLAAVPSLVGNGSIFTGGEPPDVTGTSPPPEREFSNNRKLALLALLDELAELRGEQLEKEREIIPEPTDDEKTSSEIEGIKKFQTFDGQMKALVLKLQSFVDAIQGLSSSAGLMNAAYHLRARLTQIQYYFRENAAELFDVIPHAPNIGTGRYSAPRHGKMRKPARPYPMRLWSTGIEDLPDKLDALAKDLHEFMNRLNDIPELTDEVVNASITACEGDLKYRASCLREFKDQLRHHVVARYINDLTEDLGAHVDSLKAALDFIIDVGVPVIRFYQNTKYTTDFQNLSIVAILFSGVTATTLQFSYNNHESNLSDLVNGLWISSLVFSIASALNSQLAFQWRAVAYRSPRSYLPWWIAICITSTPALFLVGAVVTFLIGLGAFTYSSKQSRAVSAIAIFVISITSGALLCAGLWFASERWAFARTKGSRWLLDIIKDRSIILGKRTGISLAKQAAKRGAKRTQEVFRALKRSMRDTPQRVAGVAGRMDDNTPNVPQDIMSRTNLPTSGTCNGDPQEGAYRSEYSVTMFDHESGSLGVDNSSAEKRKLSDRGKGNEGPIPEDKPLEANTAVPYVVVSPPRGAESSNKAPASENSQGSASASDPASPESAKFKVVVKPVVGTFEPTVTPHPSRPLCSMSSPSVLSEHHRRDSSEHQLTLPRIQACVPMLRTLRSSQLLSEHLALVKHLQFSPDGQFLATCSWDKTVLIWRVSSGSSDEFQLMYKLVYPPGIGGFVGQVAWSPSGDLLLTKQPRSIKICNPTNGACQKTIDRGRNVESVTWMPDGSGFVSLEWRMGSTLAEKRAHHLEHIVGSDLVIIGTDGKEKRNHYLDRLQVWDTVVVPGDERIVAVAKLIKSEQGLKPIKSRDEKRILIYNLITEEIEHQVPLLQEVRGITLTETGNYALVSYGNKAPPQVWRIDRIVRVQECRLVLAHTYFTKHPVNLAGPSYFGGVNDTFVLAASEDGEIYIWESASGILLHSLKAPDQEIIQMEAKLKGYNAFRLTNIACNHKSPYGLMLASAAYDGTVRIWTTTVPLPPPRSDAPSPEPAEAEGSKQALLPCTGSPASTLVANL